MKIPKVIASSILNKLVKKTDKLSEDVSKINSDLGENILSYNESEDAYYIQHGADSVPKKLGEPEISYVDINPSFGYRFNQNSAISTHTASTYGFSKFSGLSVVTNSAYGSDSNAGHLYGRPTMLSVFSDDMQTLTLRVGISDASTSNNGYSTSYYTHGTFTVRLYGIK